MKRHFASLFPGLWSTCVQHRAAASQTHRHTHTPARASLSDREERPEFCLIRRHRRGAPATMSPRSKKRRPSFRRLLKTSVVKLENKLQTRRLQQTNQARKQRKESRRLHAAVKGAAAAAAPPRPLETYCRTPEEEQEAQEAEEEFLESLPTDMLEEDDLQQIGAMARRASFVTRDLSSCGPVHSGKKRNLEVVREYEKVPRKMSRTEEKEVIHLLPIKDRTGLIPQTRHRAVQEEEEEEEEEEEGGEEEEEPEHDGATSGLQLSAAQRAARRAHAIQQRRLQIATLASAIVSDPLRSIKRVKELRGMLMEADASVAVTVRKLVMVSLTEIFKDVAPTYRIRPLTQAEKAAKVKKETQELREFEEGLLSQYKFYLEDLEQTVKDWQQQKKKRRQAVAVASYAGLAVVAVRCLTELLLALPHFNFHNNIIVVLVPLMNHGDRTVADVCCGAFRELFHRDRVGVASLAAVRVLSGLVRSFNYSVRPEVLQTLLSLRIKEVKKDLEVTAPQKKIMNNKEKKKNLSRMQRKWRKAEEKLNQELLEAEASENKDQKLKLHTETLNIVFLMYFRILKKAHRSVLLPAVLEGLANFAHLINLEFFDDLLNVLQNLVQSGELTNKENLHCIQAAFTILSGQGDVLNVDPLTFYSQLYAMLLRLHAGASNDDLIIVLRCLDAMLTRRRKQVTLQRAMAFAKRLSACSLHTLPNASVGMLAATRATLHSFPKCDFLLDNEVQGSGFYLPELDEPEHCNAQNTALWELHTLQRHYHPVVRQFARHLCQGAPSEGSSALNVELSRRSPVVLFHDYSWEEMTFNPPVDKPASKKKDHFVCGAALLDAELQRRVDGVLSAAAEDVQLDFTATHTHTHHT